VSLASRAVTGSPTGSQTGTPAIRTRALTRRFGSQVAVSSVDLDVPRGAVYGFLGPNGSGKTTTIRMLLGLIAPDSGDVELLGQAVPERSRDVLPLVGALIEGPAFHPYLSGLDNLRRLDRSDATADPGSSRSRIDAALGRVGLTNAARKRYRNYSLGMKQRLGLAAALLQPRELLVLDEPTNGLDPQGTREVRHLIADLAADGTTVLISSHLLAEVQQVATHVGIMAGGELLRQGPLEDVLADGAPRITVTSPDEDVVRGVLVGFGLQDVRAGRDDHGEPVVSAVLGTERAETVSAAVVAAGARLRGFAVERLDLEDLFVTLTGEGFDVRR